MDGQQPLKKFNYLNYDRWIMSVTFIAYLS
jgi:hypothetical protein